MTTIISNSPGDAVHDAVQMKASFGDGVFFTDERRGKCILSMS